MSYVVCPICRERKGNPVCKWCNINLKEYRSILDKKINPANFNFNDFYNYVYNQALKEEIWNRKIDLAKLLVSIAQFIQNDDLISDAFNKTKYIYDTTTILIGDFGDNERFIDKVINDYLSKINYQKQVIEIHKVNIDFRKQNPANILCQDGHYVRSKEERAIDDYLYQTAKLLHAYEPKFRLTPEEQETCKQTGKEFEYFYPDFYIPDYNLYIEFFGRNEEKYNLKTDLKIKIYSNRKNINFAYLNYNDSNILLEKLEDILENFKNKTKSTNYQ